MRLLLMLALAATARLRLLLGLLLLDACASARRASWPFKCRCSTGEMHTAHKKSICHESNGALQSYTSNRIVGVVSLPAVLQMKERIGGISRVAPDGCSAVCKGLFKRESDISFFEGAHIITGRREPGIIQVR